MREETAEKAAPLRSGYTTGACATATSYAAATLLLSGNSLNCCTITLPKGQHVNFAIPQCYHNPTQKSGDNPVATSATAETIKDAGDDPDVTHGATVFSTVTLVSQSGVTFKAGPGVGIVTRPGLPVAVGEPAINPTPRKMITSHLSQLAIDKGYPGGFCVRVGVKNGEEIAKKTMNGRLGIKGGLSILGTTGIVRPFSCSAYIASIQQGIDVALSNGEKHLFACTGNKSEDAATRLFSSPDQTLNEIALIEMGDFIGAVLKHCKKYTSRINADLANAPSLEKLTIIGGFGKLTKFAQGHLDLHSKASSIDFEFLRDIAKSLGLPEKKSQDILESNTSIEALAITNTHCKGFADTICQLGVAVARKYVAEPITLQVIAIDKQSQVVGSFSSDSLSQ